MRDRSASKAYWDNLFEQRTEPMKFGDEVTYKLGAEFIGDLPVEDWGCGLGWFRKFAQGPYKGIDGSMSMFADEVADLREHRSRTPALFMRHVLEHNPFEWRIILDNALTSFTQRMVLVIFTPMEEFELLVKDSEPPDVSLGWDELTARFLSDITWRHEQVSSATIYGIENVFYLKRPALQ